MAEITQAPEYGEVEIETGHATAEALKGLWYQEKSDILSLGRSLQTARNIISPQVLIVDTTVSIDDLHIDEFSVIYPRTSVATNFTGMVAPPQDGRCVLIFCDSATGVTVKHVSASSAVGNRFSTSTAGDIFIAPGNTAVWWIYMDGFWHQIP